MSDLNCIQMQAKLCAEPELAYTTSNTAVCKLRLASGYTWKDQGGTKKEDTCFIDAEVWGVRGEAASKWLKKGKEVLVSGRLVYQTWEKDGQKRSKHVLRVNDWHFTSGSTDRQNTTSRQPEAPDNAGGYGPGPQTNTRGPGAPPLTHDELEDLPF